MNLKHIIIISAVDLIGYVSSSEGNNINLPHYTNVFLAWHGPICARFYPTQTAGFPFTHLRLLISRYLEPKADSGRQSSGLQPEIAGISNCPTEMAPNVVCF